jgi:hypothetical protein
MAIIGDEIRDYVSSQINVRQVIHGTGAGQTLDTLRPDTVINVLNSNTSWVKLASGVSVAASKLTEIGVDTALDGLDLAKQYVLNAGFSKYEEGKNAAGETTGRLTQRDGFLPQYADSSYTYGSYGYSPMPGIISADIKALNRGSIKKATVKIKINNKEQFNIIDLLYFRLGYTVLLEWGNSMFFNSKFQKKIVRNTLIDDPNLFFNSSFGGSDSYISILPKIEEYRNTYNGNYDGLLGKISNFQWSFNKDGSYDAEITIISLGDVVESLKTNISTDRGLSQFIITSGGSSITPPSNPPTTTTTAEEQPDILEDNKDANAIASMLWVWKWVNRDAIGQTITTGKIENILSGGSSPVVGSFLNPSGATISTTTTQYKFYYKVAQKNTSNYIDLASAFPEEAKNYPDIPPVTFTADELKEDPDSFTGVSFIDLDAISKKEQEFENALGSKKEIKKTKTEIFYGGNGTTSVQDIEVTYVVSVFSEKLANSTQNVSTDSPIKNFSNKDAFWLNSAPKFPLYLRLGALLEYLQNNVLPKIDTNQTNYASKPPIFKIDSNVFNNIMYSLPNQISLDPRVCIVKNKDFSSANSAGTVKEQFFRGLLNFRTSDSTRTNVHPNKAYMMNIYLNFNFILESLNSAADERGDTNTFSFLQNICNGINKALGGINNIEPVMDEETNTLRLQDTTPIPGDNTSPSYILQLYGYERLGENQYISNFIRKIDLKTAITPEYATMITVGATAGGYVKGTEATAFSRWNEGLIDRFKEKFTPGNEVSKPDASGVDEAVTNYVEKMINISKYPATLGFLPTTETGGNGFGDESTDAIESNLSVGTEYFKYLISSQKNQQGGTVGFIPFKLGFTMDGLSGMKIYNKLHINTSFLPKAYGNTLDLIVTGVSHKLAKNDWETDIEATVIPKTNELKDLVITAAVNTAAITQAVAAGGGGKKKKGKDIPPKTDKLCGLANYKNVDKVYPKSVNWYGSAPVVVTASKLPSVSVNLKTVPVVARKKTTYTSKQVVEAAKTTLNRMAPNASEKNKKLIISAALAIAISEQSLSGYNHNLTGVEASGFQVFSSSDVVGKTVLNEGNETGKVKEYYAFKDVATGLIPVLSTILKRNMFATGGTANEFAWRYFRDWNGYGARTTAHYALPSNQKTPKGVKGYDSDDCIIISNVESTYNKAVKSVNQYY